MTNFAAQKTDMKTTVMRVERFNAAHKLYRKDWSDEKNKAVFGVCANPNFHGHNYKLTVKVTGDVDAETGFVIDLRMLSDLIKKEVLDKFDHQNLNLDTAEFKELNPSAENIARVIHEIMRSKLDSKLELQILLAETENNIVQYPA